MEHHLRHLRDITHLARPFGDDRFGKLAERFARAFGTPIFIISQTILVIIWISLNVAVFTFQWDPYPFILLNLAFSTQAAYAAPMILLAQTRQADRDKAHIEATARHHQEESDQLKELLAENTELTERVATLTEAIHHKISA